MSIESKLKAMGLTLPEPPQPIGSYVPFVITSNLLFLSGILPLVNGKLLKSGKVGSEITAEEGAKCAKIATLNGLAVVKNAIGDLDNIVKCVKLTGYVAGTTEFYSQPSVLNGASDLLYEIFGERGRHARAAVGVSALPINSPIEIDFIFEIKTKNTGR